jgi:ABC-type nitrate/sulfonate/bicarbonate transport system substrate-binding protein
MRKTVRSAPATRGRFLTGTAASLAAFAAGRRPLRAQSRAPLRMNLFGGLDAWPVYVMHERALLAGAGYDLTLTTTTGSVSQFAHMANGDADLALTAFDNVVAYDQGQGDPSVTAADFTAFLGVGPGFLALVTRPEIATYEDMRGKAFAVDAVGTGFSFVLRRMLAQHGLMPGDYTFVSLGSTQQRFNAIASGQCIGGMVGAPFDTLGAQTYGFHVFARALDVLGTYQATVMMARRPWATANAPALRAVVRAYRAATAWLYDPAHRSEAQAILARNTDFAPALIAQVAPAVLGSATSYSRTGRIDAAGAATVMELRARYALPNRAPGDPAAFIDTRAL